MIFYPFIRLYHYIFNRSLVMFALSDEFYDSQEWMDLAYRTRRYWFKRKGRKCALCRRSKDRKGQPIEMHVDHIKPRSKYPWLALTFSNLQVLCAEDNLGKSNVYEDDWR
jgi:hypothetical protein